MELPIDYMTLRVIWWGLVGVLLIGFAIMDGFDMGVAALLPFVAKNDSERRAVINTVGATWEGNQVWFILGGGAVFAAWPFVYAVSFSGFYLAMFLVLTALILRPVGFKYRSKRPGRERASSWRFDSPALVRPRTAIIATNGSRVSSRMPALMGLAKAIRAMKTSGRIRAWKSFWRKRA